MIKKLLLPRLVSAEFYQFLFLILGIVDRANPELQKIKPQRDALATLVARLVAALNREQANALSKVLDDLDLRRDTAISGFALWIRALSMHPTPTTRGAAKAIRLYLKAQGESIASQNQQQESATLTKIVNDFKNDVPLKNNLSTLNDPAWMAEIEEVNNLYIEIYQRRTSELGAQQQGESFSAVRRLAVVAYLELATIIETRFNAAKADGTPLSELQNMVNDINATIDQYKQLIAQTQVRKKKEEPTA